MEEIGLLSKYMHDYGPLIVILSVFLIIFIAVIVYLINTNKKMFDSSEELNEQLINSLIDNAFERNSKALAEQKPYDERNIVNIFMELNRTLKTACDRMMRQTTSDRTAIYVFHNGAHASHGLPFFKVTCICETISKASNMNIKIGDHSSVPLNVFDSIVDSLYTESQCRIITDESNDPSELIFLRDTKIKDCFFAPIYDDDNNMMGFIFNGYNTYDSNRTIESEMAILSTLAMTAKPVIEYSRCQQYQSDKEE